MHSLGARLRRDTVVSAGKSMWLRASSSHARWLALALYRRNSIVSCVPGTMSVHASHTELSVRGSVTQAGTQLLIEYSLLTASSIKAKGQGCADLVIKQYALPTVLPLSRKQETSSAASGAWSDRKLKSRRLSVIHGLASRHAVVALHAQPARRGHHD